MPPYSRLFSPSVSPYSYLNSATPSAPSGYLSGFSFPSPASNPYFLTASGGANPYASSSINADLFAAAGMGVNVNFQASPTGGLAPFLLGAPYYG